MSIKIGDYYAMDHDNGEQIETNVVLVLSKRKNNEIEVEADFYVTETMELVDGKYDGFYTNDWLREFLEREATEDEIRMFKKHRKGLVLEDWAYYLIE